VKGRGVGRGEERGVLVEGSSWGRRGERGAPGEELHMHFLGDHDDNLMAMADTSFLDTFFCEESCVLRP
jgi:hypothetical protein